MTGQANMPGQVLRTRVCDVLGIAHPVVQAGMGGGYVTPALVAAVSNAGGLGTFAASWLSREEVQTQTARTRDLTQAPFALNLLLFGNEDLLDVALAAPPAVMAFAWAAPDQPLDRIFGRAHDAGCKVMYQAPSVREAVRAVDAGADVIVAQGNEGGGHVGLMGTMPLVPMVVRAVRPAPVLAAGGIADGRGLAAALALGADGVLLGTRFLATPESALHPNFKQAIVDSDGHDTTLSRVFDLIGGVEVACGRYWPGALCRGRDNALIRKWSGREWELRERRAAVREEVRAAAKRGDVDWSWIYYGQDAGLITAIEPAGQIVGRIVREACDILAGCRSASAAEG